MAKKKVVKPQREITRRQLARWQQEKKRQRIILGIGIFIITAVCGIVAAGWYTSQYRPLHQTVIRVNDTKFNMNYYIKALEYYGARYLGGLTFALADEVVSVIQRNELVRQGAIDLEISISRDEVNQEIKSRDISKDYSDLVRAEMLTTKLLEEYFDAGIPASGEQRKVMAMLLENESQATDVRARLEADEDFAALAKELSLEGISRAEEGDFDWVPKGVLAGLLGSSVLEDAAFGSEVGVLSQPIYDEAVNKTLGYWLIEVLERMDDIERTHVKVILLGSKEEAQSVRARLEAGEDFAALAKEFSQDDISRENGGDVGWVDKGIMSSAFAEFALKSEVGVVSQPIRDEEILTKGGYWLLKVVDKDDNHKIEGENRSILRAYAFREWLLAVEDDPANKVETFLDDEKKAQAIDYATKNITAKSRETR